MVMVIVIVTAIVTFLGQFCPRRKGAMSLTLCEATTRETRPDHNTGGNYVYVPSEWLDWLLSHSYWTCSTIQSYKDVELELRSET